MCWGDNSFGQTNIPPSGTDGFLALAAGFSHTCGIQTDKTVVCWGYNIDKRSSPPVGLQAQTSPHISYQFEKVDSVPAAVRLARPSPPFATEIHTDRHVIPEGTAASILVRSVASGRISGRLEPDSNPQLALRPAAVNLGGGARSAVMSLSATDRPSAQTVSTTLSLMFSSNPPASLNQTKFHYVIPPNDLTATLSGPPIVLESRGATQKVTFEINKQQGSKSFLVFSTDSRIVIDRGIVTPDRNSFSVVLGLSRDAVVPDAETVPLYLVHLDALRLSANTQISAGHEHACVVRDDRTIACWGNDDSDQIILPAPLKQAEFLTVSSGFFHNCGIQIDNTMACWGEDAYGVLTPPQDSVHARFLSVSAGEIHTCAIRIDNAVVCWGARDALSADVGQASDAPKNSKFLTVSAGSYHNCAIRVDSTVHCWGDDRNFQVRNTPPADNKFHAVAAGFSHSCGIKIDNTLACWGTSRHGLVHGRPQDDTFLAVGSGNNHSCAIRSNQTMACWGQGSQGETTPPPLTPFVAVSGGSYYTCGIRIDGSPKCWGQDTYGKTFPPPGLKAHSKLAPLYLSEKTDIIQSAVHLPTTITSLGKAVLVKVHTGQQTIPEGSETFILLEAVSEIPRPIPVSYTHLTLPTNREV